MKNPNQPYTLGHWTAKAGNEKAFITEWTAFARWTAKTQSGAGRGILLQDPEHPRKLISLGPWGNVDAIKVWRESPEFKAFALKVRDLCDDFQPRSLVLVAASEE